MSRQGIQKLFDRAVDKIKEIFTKDCEEHLKSFLRSDEKPST